MPRGGGGKDQHEVALPQRWYSVLLSLDDLFLVPKKTVPVYPDWGWGTAQEQKPAALRAGQSLVRAMGDQPSAVSPMTPRRGAQLVLGTGAEVLPGAGIDLIRALAKGQSCHRIVARGGRA